MPKTGIAMIYKGDLVAKLYEMTGMKKAVIETVLNDLSDAAYELLDVATMGNNEARLVLPNFCVIAVRHFAEHEGRNPSTGETITVPAKRRVSIKATGSFGKRFV